MKTTVCRRALSAASAAVVALVDEDDDDGGGGGEARALSPVRSFLPLVSRDYSEEGSGDAAVHVITARGSSEQPHLQ